VRDTVGAFAEAVVCICANDSVAIANTQIAKESFFTEFSIWGNKNRLICLIIFVDVARNTKNRKG
jgi:hypothetical protein